MRRNHAPRPWIPFETEYGGGYEKSIMAGVDLLLSARANVNQPCIRGKTPLFYAMAHNYGTPVLTQLLNAKADINLRDADGRNALEWCVFHVEDDPDLESNEDNLPTASDYASRLRAAIADCQHYENDEPSKPSA